jgi:hypothetical protein
MSTTIRLRPLAEAQESARAGVYLLAPHVAPTSATADKVTAEATSTSNGTPHVAAIIVAFLLVGVAWWFAVNGIHDAPFGSTPVRTPVEGLTIFGVFFVGAQAIERFLEPLTKLWGSGADDDFITKLQSAKETYAAAIKAWEASPTGDAAKAASKLSTDAATALQAAADAKAGAATVKGNRAVIFWGIATSVAVLTSAGLKLYFLRVVGIADAPRVWEVLATGLIIGGGTKPLHDLVELIQAKKEQSKSGANAPAA